MLLLVPELKLFEYKFNQIISIYCEVSVIFEFDQNQVLTVERLSSIDITRFTLNEFNWNYMKAIDNCC